MANKKLLKVALRYQAIYVKTADGFQNALPTPPAVAFLARLRERGYSVSEDLWHALCSMPVTALSDITEVIDEALGVNLNWTPLVRGWDVPTGESLIDHLITLFANILDDGTDRGGTRLPCGHIIPDGTFNLDRYTGCPFCGKPFETNDWVFMGQGTKTKELTLWRLEDAQRALNDLLTSPVPLDASQVDSLGLLLDVLGLPDKIDITMKETRMKVVNFLVEGNCSQDAERLLSTPAEILRYLWYVKTGRLQVVEPRTLVLHASRLNRNMWPEADNSLIAADLMKKNLKLKYDRKTCRCVAHWLNDLNMTAQAAAESMHTKRGMWVQMIRALRLGEYSRRQGMQHLADILDTFYHQDYQPWLGQLDSARHCNDKERVLSMLQQRPGLFARSLFASMLRYGDDALMAFDKVMDSVPARLILSLANNAETYFDLKQTRVVRTIIGDVVNIDPNPLLKLYSPEQLQSMVAAVTQLYATTMSRRFAAIAPPASHGIFIDPGLFDIPVAVGDRSSTIQDTSCALQGTRFKVEGDAVRLFLQWGKGLPAQHLDMDLSCKIIYPVDSDCEECAYFKLEVTGAKHSGDIRHIPDQVGTAEYIELDLAELNQWQARYVVFTCNAYTNGSLSPNLMVGWMDSSQPMTVDDNTGVAYDPSCVQHIVRVGTNDLSKGLVFGVLDVPAREITWLEMPFMSQTVIGLNVTAVDALLTRLRNKLSIGQLLTLKAQAQGLNVVEDPEQADEAYTMQWALDPARVAQLINL